MPDGFAEDFVDESGRKALPQRAAATSAQFAPAEAASD